MIIGKLQFSHSFTTSIDPLAYKLYYITKYKNKYNNNNNNNNNKRIVWIHDVGRVTVKRLLLNDTLHSTHDIIAPSEAGASVNYTLI